MCGLHFYLIWPCWHHTGHVNHPAVAVLQQVPGFTVNAAGADAVCGEVLRIYGSGLAVSPRRWEVLKLQEQMEHVLSHDISTRDYNKRHNASPAQQRETKEDNRVTKPNTWFKHKKNDEVQKHFSEKWARYCHKILHQTNIVLLCRAAGRRHAEHYWCRSSPR